MASNSFRKVIAQHDEPAVKSGLRKPPQGTRAIDTRTDSVDLRVPPSDTTADCAHSAAEKPVLSGTWTEAIRDPQVWAELRPLLVEED
jgi:hypothetical protein